MCVRFNNNVTIDSRSWHGLDICFVYNMCCVYCVHINYIVFVIKCCNTHTCEVGEKCVSSAHGFVVD